MTPAKKSWGRKLHGSKEEKWEIYDAHAYYLRGEIYVINSPRGWSFLVYIFILILLLLL